jgi:4-aminobutyrate aminotransferase-like enzyme
VGVEMIVDNKLSPATRIAAYIVNRMKEKRILIGVEGPSDNILKIRPPLTINDDDIDCILISLEECLNEVRMFTS